MDHKARHTSNTPRHIFTLPFPPGWVYIRTVRSERCGSGLQNIQQHRKRMDMKVHHRGLGELKRREGWERGVSAKVLLTVPCAYKTVINSREEASVVDTKFLLRR